MPFVALLHATCSIATYKMYEPKTLTVRVVRVLKTLQKGNFLESVSAQCAHAVFKQQVPVGFHS